MLDKSLVKKLTLDECNFNRKAIKEEQVLTATRIYQLLVTQDKNPGWTAYCKYADEMVDIGIRIEEQYAVAEMLEDELQQIEQRIDLILEVVAIPGGGPRVEKPVYQLDFFDSDKKRKRMELLCLKT